MEFTETLPDPATRPVLLAEEAGRLLGMKRAAAYDAIRTGRWPTRVIRIGRSVRIPTAEVLALINGRAA